MAPPTKEELRRGSRELKEALEHVGVLMQLPPKRPSVEARTPPPQKEAAKAAAGSSAGSAGDAGPADRSGRPWRATRFLPALAGLMVLIVGGIWLLPDETVALPEPVVGRWETSHPRYREGSMVFTKETVTLRVNASAPAQTHEIVRVKTVRVEDSTHVVVTYKDGDGELDLEFAVMGLDGRVMTFARPAGLTWNRTAP